MNIKERKWVIIVTIMILIITTIPYFYGFMNQGEDWYFTGFVFGVEDGNSYIAKMLRGTAGDWLFHSPYSPYYQRGFLAFFPYILLGKLISSPGVHEQLIVLFHIYRWIAGLAMALASYRFIAMLIKDTAYRKIGFVIIIAGGGLGWISILANGHIVDNRIPLELYSPESFSLLSVYGLPHLAMARALLLWGFVKYVEENERINKPGIQAGIIWLVMGLFQPLYIVVTWLVILTHNIFLFIKTSLQERCINIVKHIDQCYFNRMISSVLISSIFVIYTLISFNTDQYLIGWSEQNIIKSPPVIDYLLSYGIFIPFAIFSSGKIINDKNDKALMLVGWLVIFPLLAYAPINIQRRLLEGYWVVLITLTIFAIRNLGNIKNTIWKILIIFSLINFVLIIYGGIISVATTKKPLFRSAREINVIKELNSICEPGDIVLANYELSNVIPAWTPVFTILGHGPESINLVEIQEEVDEFFDPDYPVDKKKSIIEDFKINFIIFGPDEQIMRENDFKHQGIRLQRVYHDGEYSIYAVDY